ncbi:MAG: undecaprenyl-phosphate glucose phosphotransferase [Gallionella sp.]
MIHSSATGLIRPYSSSLAVLFRALDVLIIAFGMYLAARIYAVELDSPYLLIITLSALIFLFVAEARGLYQSWRVGSLFSECACVLVVWSVVVICLLALGFVSGATADFSRGLLVLWGLLVPVVMCLKRTFVRQLLRLARVHGRNTRTVAFAGSGGVSLRMKAHLAEMPWAGLHMLGTFDDRLDNRVGLSDEILMGDFTHLIEMARSGAVDIVYITLPMQAELRIINLIEQLADTTAAVYLVPDLFVFSLYRARWVTVGSMPVISTLESPFYGIESWLKRAEDVLIAGFILTLIWPLLLLIAFGVKFSSDGPVIFRQRRYGLKGEVVEVWKFRSMKVSDDESQIRQVCKGDSRLTRFGAFLRRTSLDELPQFINVLQGTMSIVGPRPHAVAHNEQYRKLIRGYMLRHKVKPGITGLAQVSGFRGETDTLDKMQKRVEYDLEYIQTWSLWLDIKIILKTVLVGFVGKNVY